MKKLLILLFPFLFVSCVNDSSPDAYKVNVQVTPSQSLSPTDSLAASTVKNGYLVESLSQVPFQKDVAVMEGDYIFVTIIHPKNKQPNISVKAIQNELSRTEIYSREPLGEVPEGHLVTRYKYDIPSL